MKNNQFSIEEPTQISFSNLSTTTELHGEKRMPAVDMKLKIQTSAEFLAELDPSLRGLLYRKAEKGEGDLADHMSKEPTKLRYPLMGPIKWDLELENYQMTVDIGLGDKLSNIVLPEVKVSNFLIIAKDGGTVEVTFSVRAHPDEKQAGRLYEKQAQDIFIMLMPPEEMQAPLDGMH